MKTEIQNIDDLRAERARLKNQLELSKTHMQQEVKAIKSELNPMHQAVGLVGDMLTAPKKGLLSVGVSIGVNTLLKRGLLARAGWLPRLVVPVLAQNLAANLIYKHRTSLLENALRWVKKVTDKPTPKPAAAAPAPVAMKALPPAKHLNGKATLAVHEN
ncbi:MAG: hypothetical protein U0X91_06470 [Spirosomataceae bacterium]